MPLPPMHIYTVDEFSNYLFNNTFTRPIKCIQNHHTWKPDYTNLAKYDEMYWMVSMRNVHTQNNGWDDIAQNLTTFPSGNIGLCRPIDVKPVGIAGANTGAICIEHLGNFDAGKDVMTAAHKDTIIALNALLCKKFGLAPVKSQVVYHHWYERSGTRFPENIVNEHKVGAQQKTCPGTAFFGGNTILDAEANFYPLITTAIQTLSAPVAPVIKKKVNTGTLNVRKGPGTNFSTARQLALHTEVTVYAEKGDWSKISNTAEEWVFSKFLT